MNDDIVVQKILKLLENNTAFIGYALNGGIGTKINVRNTETGKTIQALSINVDSSGEVLVVKDSDDGKYKAVTFKAAQQTTERIVQIRKTKPVDDKKIIEYTDTDIEVFYLFVKLIDTGFPVSTQLQSTWIRKGSSCTQFVGAYERCNYGAKETIGGTSFTGLPYKPYSSLNDCLADDLGRDAKTPHGTGDENGANLGWKIYSTKMTADAEQNLLAALISHDEHYGTNYKKLFGYGSILECSGAMYVQGWEAREVRDPITNVVTKTYFQCEFSFLPGFTTDCTLALRNAGYCDNRGFINSKTPPLGHPDAGGIDNSWAYQYGWIDLPYDFMYKRHFMPSYLNGAPAQGSFLILETNEDQTPTIPEGYFPWVPGCPSDLGDGGPYNGGGGNRFPDGPPKPKKRDMKLSTYEAEIWLGSSKKTEAIKLYELGASDLFSGMYNAFIARADETQVDIENRLKRNMSPTTEDEIKHTKFYENWNKNTIDLRIDPRVLVYIINNIPKINNLSNPNFYDPANKSLQLIIDHLYNRTLNLTVVDNKTQVIHLKLGLVPKNTLSNTDCRGTASGSSPVPNSINQMLPGQSWEYQKYVTIKVKNWKIESTNNTLDTSSLPNNTWNKNYIERRFFTFFPVSHSLGSQEQIVKDIPNNIVLRSDNSVSLTDLILGNHYEQYNYSYAVSKQSVSTMTYFANFRTHLRTPININDSSRFVMRGTSSWWAMWDKTMLDANSKRLNTIVGFDINYYQILTSAGLNPNLDYLQNSNQVFLTNYWEYLPNRPKLFVPSNVRTARNKLANINLSNIKYLTTRANTLNLLGLNFLNSFVFSSWTNITNINRLDGIQFPFLALPSSYSTPSFELTREQSLFNGNAVTSSSNVSTRINTGHWFNRLWTQLVYDGFVKVDIDSYKNVEFNLPTNPGQYIKFSNSTEYINSEFPFALDIEQPLETVLTPGVLDVTKQTTIKKPTNVELDPNYSFLMYIFPLVSVTKKKKEI